MYLPWEPFTTAICLSVSILPRLLILLTNLYSVQKSLVENDLTVLSIFVNPAQFAPHEDLATYPRTLPRDLELLTAQQVNVGEVVRKASAVFLPQVRDMYPSGISQDISAQKGTFVEIKGYGHQMEGASRPTFFRGVTTIVTKLFNAVQVRRPLRQTRLGLMNFNSPRMHISARKISSKPYFFGDSARIYFSHTLNRTTSILFPPPATRLMD